MNRIEHPSRNGDLESFGELNYETLFVEPAQSAHYFDFRSIKRVISVMDFLEREFVSSMMMLCGIRSPLTCLKTVTTFAQFRNSWATKT
jgi:hypothetical protein